MSSIIQIFGTNKCKDTQKALRFFKERNIKIQFVNLAEKAMAKGELESVKRHVTLEDLIDKDSKAYKDRNLAFIIHDIETELLENPLLLKTPITRFGQKATVGVDTNKWKEWAKEAK